MTTLPAMYSPHTVQRSWNMTRGAPIVAPPRKLFVRTLSVTQRIEIDTSEDMTVGMLKAEVAVKIASSPRKALELRWYGTLLEDQYVLQVQDSPQPRVSERELSATCIAQPLSLTGDLACKAYV